MNQKGDVAIRETVLRKEIVLFGVTNPVLTLVGGWHSGERLLAGLFSSEAIG